MNEQQLPVPSAAKDLLVERLPLVFRIQSIARLPFDAKAIRTCATLFHERATIRVEWLSQHPDVRLTVGSLVSIRWSGRAVTFDGAVRIARLVLIEKPVPALNLFDTIPHRWLRDRELAKRGAALWKELPRGFQHLFNAIFWDGGRFRRFVEGPSAINGDHHVRNGNLRHSIDVAGRAMEVAAAYPAAHMQVLILASLLHDAGKADEYRLAGGHVELSARGRLVGYRHTVVEWIAVARACHRVIVSDADYLALMHALTSAKGVPPNVGLREPQSLDATILQFADGRLTRSDLIGRHIPPDIGFARYHPHLGARPFAVRPAV
ncbi:HD domain-containing protein [Aromatoleum evansii]|nr:metal-dependent phosphohydrolase [Aromatoleum evansii]